MPAAGLTRMHAMASIPPTRPPRPLLDAFRVNPLTLLLIAAINTGIALVLWIDDTRPFWQPLLTVQLYGFSIAYCVNVAKPWDHEKPLRRLVAQARGIPFARTLEDLVDECSAAGFRDPRLITSAFGRVALLRAK